MPFSQLYTLLFSFFEHTPNIFAAQFKSYQRKSAPNWKESYKPRTGANPKTSLVLWWILSITSVIHHREITLASDTSTAFEVGKHLSLPFWNHDANAISHVVRNANCANSTSNWLVSIARCMLNMTSMNDLTEKLTAGYLSYIFNMDEGWSYENSHKFVHQI